MKSCCEYLLDRLPQYSNYKQGTYTVIKTSRLTKSCPTILSASGSKFTKSKDRLGAFGRAIRKIEPQITDTCYACIWRRNSERNLLWFIRHPVVLELYRAPSWSWASVESGDGGVDSDSLGLYYVDKPSEKRAIPHVLDVDVQPVGIDTKGSYVAR